MNKHLVPTPAAALAILAAHSVSPALAVSLGDMAAEGAANLEAIGPFVSAGFWIVGIIIAGIALLKLKRHFEHPQQGSVAAALIALAIGAGLIAAPSLINGLAETFGITGGETVAKPKF